MEINVVNEIYAQFDKNQREEKRERKHRHYPSGLAAIQDGNFVGKCRRALYYEWNRVVPSNPIEAVAWFKMAMGNVIHDFLDSVMDKALAGKEYAVIDSEFCGDEKPIVWPHPGLKYPLSMRIDKIFELGGKRYACEWKSSYGYGVTMIQKEGIKDDNLLQSMCYLEQDVIPLDGLLLVYVARDTGYLFGFLIEKAEGGGYSVWSMNSNSYTKIDWSFDGVVAATHMFEEMVDSDVMPDRDYECRVVTSREGSKYLDPKGDWHCRYCSFADICYFDAPLVKAPPKVEPKPDADPQLQLIQE